MNPETQAITASVLKAQVLTEKLQADCRALKNLVDNAIEDFNVRTGLRITRIECSYNADSPVPFLTIWDKHT